MSCHDFGTTNQEIYSLRSMDALVKLNELIFRMGRLEQLGSEVIKQQAASKEFYTVKEIGKFVDLSPYTVREHCRLLDFFIRGSKQPRRFDPSRNSGCVASVNFATEWQSSFLS